LAAALSAHDSATLQFTREDFRGGGSTPAVSLMSEIYLVTSNSSTLRLTNSLLAHSLGDAVFGNSYDTSHLHVWGVTAADNAQGARLSKVDAGSVCQAVNSIFWNPAGALHAQFSGVSVSNSLTGVDPGFLAPSLSDYSLRRSGSPAMNAGNNALAASAIDLPGATRIQNGTLDIGAWESSDRIYADRFDY
jgi:hypothetical protein